MNGTEIHEMRLESPTVSESKEVFKKIRQREREYSQQWGHIKGTQEPAERTPNDQSCNNLSRKISISNIGS